MSLDYVAVDHTTQAGRHTVVRQMASTARGRGLLNMNSHTPKSGDFGVSEVQ